MYRRHDKPTALLVGYDPCVELPDDHLARLVEAVVEGTVRVPRDPVGPGQPKFDPRLCIKVPIYGYAAGVRSSRQLEKQCQESLPYLFLTRGDTPSYRTLCSARLFYQQQLLEVWVGLFAAAKSTGLRRLGRIVVDSSKLGANASREMILDRQEYAQVKQELEKILAEAQSTDQREDEEGYPGQTRTGKVVDNLQMRDILRKVRRQVSRQQSNGEDGAEKDTDPTEVKRVTGRMRQRIADALRSVDRAQSQGDKHLCLRDPDARMMLSGVEKKLRECHSLEIAVDRECRLLVWKRGDANRQRQRAPDIAC